jgi:hypothetical protein
VVEDIPAGTFRVNRAALVDEAVFRVFPNLIILDLMGVVVRKLEPTAAGHTRITQWSLATAGESADMRARRLENFITFQGPGGFATPDDLEALEACQAGFRARVGVPWSDISRGMHREHSGQSCGASDELQMRGFWRQWQQRISAGCDSPLRSGPGQSAASS